MTRLPRRVVLLAALAPLAAHAAPHLDEPEVIESPTGTHPVAKASEGIDAYALTHNETSTGVMMPLARPEGIADDALVLVDATSAACAPLRTPRPTPIGRSVCARVRWTRPAAAEPTLSRAPVTPITDVA